jgi:hypothetical protein
VFENRVLRRIFGPKRNEVTEEWRRLHKEELHDLYSSSIIIYVIKSRMRLVGHVVHMWERRGANKVLVGKPEEKRPLGRPRCRREDNIKINSKEIILEGVDWIHLAGCCEHGDEPLSFIKCGGMLTS